MAKFHHHPMLLSYIIAKLRALGAVESMLFKMHADVIRNVSRPLQRQQALTHLCCSATNISVSINQTQTVCSEQCRVSRNNLVSGI